MWLSFRYNNQTYALGILYRPPDFPSNNFLADLEFSLSIVSPRFDYVICTGDLNIDCLGLNDNSLQKLNDLLECFDLNQIIDEPTRYSETSAKLIDVICCSHNIPIKNTHVSAASSLFSDHCLVSCTLGRGKYKYEPFQYTFRDYKYFDHASFTNDLKNANFDQIFNFIDINDKVNCFNNLLLNLFDLYAPIKTVMIRKKKSPWLTDNIRAMMSLRDKALAKFKKSKLERDWKYYKDLKNLTNYSIKREKKAYLEFNLNNTRGNKKGIWKHLKDLDVHTKQKNRSIPDSLSNVETINKFFITSSNSDLALDAATLNHYTNSTRENIVDFSFKQINDIEIYKTILSFKSKAVGVDNISLSMLLYACPYILPYICHIFNFAIEKGIYPAIWKKSRVIPLPKVTNPEELKDLRPISILCCLSKVFEKIINNQIRVHLDEFNILPTHQSGFRSGHSCTTALLKVTDDIFTAIDQNNLCLLILLDYSKAFDRIKHQLLLAIFHYIGFTEQAKLLIKNYLTQRFQSVILGSSESDFALVENGVPQGSILGPLLFTLYTFQFYEHLRYSHAHFYADDTQIYMSFPETDVQTACTNLNHDLESLVSISTKFCLEINPSKSKVILFGRDAARKRCSNLIRIQVNNKILQQSTHEKNLGLAIDNRLRFSQHVTMITKRAFCNLKLIYNNKSILNKKCKILLCDSLVLSHLNFADCVYGPALNKTDTRRLQLIQNSCIRLICGLGRREHVTKHLKEVEWLNTEQRRILHSCVLFHKIITLQQPSYLYNKIKYRTDVHNINVRRKGHITIPQHSTALFQSSYSYNIARLYNKVPDDMKRLPLFSFKKKLKKMLLMGNFLF